MRVGFAAVLVLLAGCASPAPGDGGDGGEPGSAGEGSIVFQWVDPDDGERKPQTLSEHHTMWIEEGVGRVSAQDRSDEGHDFRLELAVWFDGTPTRHAYDAALSGPGTFRFQYEEAPFWAGRQICDVSSVSEASWVKVGSWTAAADRFEGTSLLDFDGTCDEAPDGGETGGHVRLEDGVFR